MLAVIRRLTLETGNYCKEVLTLHFHPFALQFHSFDTLFPLNYVWVFEPALFIILGAIQQNRLQSQKFCVEMLQA